MAGKKVESKSKSKDQGRLCARREQTDLSQDRDIMEEKGGDKKSGKNTCVCTYIAMVIINMCCSVFERLCSHNLQYAVSMKHCAADKHGVVVDSW